MPYDPEMIQRLSASFNIVNDLTVDFTSTVNPMDAQFGTLYVVGGDSHIFYATTATWNSQPQLIASEGYIYIYSDYKQDGEGRNIAGFKVGDGSTYLIDLPFTDEQLQSHLLDTVCHITQAEREKWNNKVRCYMSEVQDDILIFTTN